MGVEGNVTGGDTEAWTVEQGRRARQMFCAVVLSVLDEAIEENKRFRKGTETFASWARSKDGRKVLTCAGINPDERTVKGLIAFIEKGIKTSIALSRSAKEQD